jgi:hypothetical protein
MEEGVIAPDGTKLNYNEVNDEEVENEFFDRFEEMTDCNLDLNDNIRDFVKNNQSKFI